MEENKDRTSITIDPEVLHQIKKMAAFENRSFSNMVEKILVEYIKEIQKAA
jgi:predicted CopG family antitoxin